MPEATIVAYDCPLGDHHTVPGEDVRVLKARDGGFVIACDCSDEPLEEVHEPPHDTVDVFVNVGGNDPRPSQWLALEDLADGWYDTNPWRPVDDGAGTYAQHRQRLRDRAAEIADEHGPSAGIDGGEDGIDRAAREVECPDCDASEGTKCQRPSGHSVRKCHNARVEAAVEDGVIDADDTDREAYSGPIGRSQQRFDVPGDDEHDPEPLATNELPKTRQDRLGAWSR